MRTRIWTALIAVTCTMIGPGCGVSWTSPREPAAAQPAPAAQPPAPAPAQPPAPAAVQPPAPATVQPPPVAPPTSACPAEVPSTGAPCAAPGAMCTFSVSAGGNEHSGPVQANIRCQCADDGAGASAWSCSNPPML